MSRGPIPDKDADRPTVPDVIALCRAYYAIPGNEMGGNLHVVLDDGNLEDHLIESCRERARARDDYRGVVIADFLLEMTRTQRAKLYAAL